MSTKKTYHILSNSRFFVLASSVLISLLVISFIRVQVTSDQVFYIRSEQVFGLLSITYWYVALIISPLGYVIGKQRLLHLAFARRAIGVSACYFASLHIIIATWGQLGGISGIGYLPDSFKLSMAGGFAAFFILFLMAMTSFDKVISFMTFRRWKWLHRLVYMGGVLAVLHIWSVGTHLSYSPVQIGAFVALSLLIGLEAFRLVTLLAKQYDELKSKDYFYTLVIAIWLVGSVALFAIPGLIKNYHSSHHSPVANSREVHT
jgi:DMSO/TMAO reductase YedYZ heme-binding membrane subunit